MSETVTVETETEAAARQVLARLKPPFIDLIKHLFSRGTSAFLFIFGRRETGKTDMALLLAEILYALGIVEAVATNIKIYRSWFPIERVDNLDDLEAWCHKYAGRKLFILDEAGRAMPRRQAMSSLNRKLIDKLQILRKYKLSSIWIAPHDKYVDTNSLGSDVLDGLFLKPNFQNPKVALYHDSLEDIDKTITGVPPTSISFDTWDSAPFTERSSAKAPSFKDKDKELLWKWSNGATAETLGMARMQISRLSRRFIKEVLQRERNT